MSDEAPTASPERGPALPPPTRPFARPSPAPDGVPAQPQGGDDVRSWTTPFVAPSAMRVPTATAATAAIVAGPDPGPTGDGEDERWRAGLAGTGAAVGDDDGLSSPPPGSRPEIARPAASTHTQPVGHPEERDALPVSNQDTATAAVVPRYPPPSAQGTSAPDRRPAAGPHDAAAALLHRVADRIRGGELLLWGPQPRTEAAALAAALVALLTAEQGASAPLGGPGSAAGGVEL